MRDRRDAIQLYEKYNIKGLGIDKAAYCINEAEKANALLKQYLGSKSWMGFVCGIGGQKKAAEKILTELKEAENNEYVSSEWVATVLFGLGRSDEAFEYLEKAFLARSSHLFYFRNFPWFEKFRADPRWASLERRIGLWKQQDLDNS